MGFWALPEWRHVSYWNERVYLFVYIIIIGSFDYHYLRDSLHDSEITLFVRILFVLTSIWTE